MFDKFLTKCLKISSKLNADNIANSEQEIRQYLKQQTEVRFLFPDTPNLGRQTTVFNILKFITNRFGPLKLVRVVWDNRHYAGRSVDLDHSRGPVATLFGLKPADLERSKKELNNTPIRFTPLSKMKEEKEENLAIGAYEESSGFDKIPPPDSQLNLTVELKVKYFIVLQSYMWRFLQREQHTHLTAESSGVMYSPEQIQFRPGHFNWHPINFENEAAVGNTVFLKRGYFVSDPRKISDKEWSSLSGKDKASDKFKKCKFVKKLLKGVDNNEIDLCPTYGVGIKNQTTANSKTLLRNLMTGLFLYQSERKRGQKPIVIIDFSRNKEQTELEELKKTIEQDPKLKDGIGIVGKRYSSLDFKKLKASKVYYINIETVNSRVFNFVYSKATLPFVFEGQGTAALAINLGKPFIKLPNAWGHASKYPAMNLNELRSNRPSQIMTELEELAKDIASDPPSDDFPERITKLITSARLAPRLRVRVTAKTGNAYRDYFSELREFYHNPNEDKVMLALGYFNAIRSRSM